MTAAATAWDALAVELSSIAASYGAVTTELTGGKWLGPSSLSMAAAAAPYAAWLQRAAVQAEKTAAQAKEAAAAYELAFAMTVPPPVIAANRSLLMTLIATNFFGQNTPAIAVTEAQYAEMWAQDAAAMYSYAASSASASALEPFNSPQQNTNSDGTTNQATAVAQATSTSAGNTQSTVLMAAESPSSSSIPSAVESLVTDAAAAPSSDTVTSLQSLITIGLTPSRFVNIAVGYSSAATSGRAFTITNMRLAGGKNTHPGEVDGAVDSQQGPAGTLVSSRSSGSPVSAATGRASPVGSLSVPANWTRAAPEVRQIALTLPDYPDAAAGAAADVPQVPGNSFSQALLGTLSREEGTEARRQKNRPIIVRSPAAG